MQIIERVKNLQGLMEQEKLDIFIVGKQDPHLSEYAESYYSEQLKFLSGFTGSNGLIVVTKNNASFWTDGRYYTQGKLELKGTNIEFSPPVELSMEKFILTEIENQSKILGRNAVLGLDARTFPINLVKNLIKADCEIKNVDLLSKIWTDRPCYKKEKVFELDILFAGKSRADKITDMLEEMKENELESYVLSSLDDIAWLLNLRGNDILYSPVFTSFLVINDGNVTVYTSNIEKFDDVKGKLKEDNINVCDFDEFDRTLTSLKGKKVGLNPNKTAYYYYDKLENSTIVEIEIDYSTKAKAIKNETEIKGAYKANKYFTTGLVKTLCFIEDTLNNVENEAKTNDLLKDYNADNITEYAVGEILDIFCKMNENYKGPSFTPIAAYKENGAIMHYSAKKDDSELLTNKHSLLLDCGGQYFCGTTDVTRTFTLGKSEVDKELTHHYTLVLQGHIGISTAIFPSGTLGNTIDMLARWAMWQECLDFQHGTGHGLSSFLNVHEGPQGISQKSIKVGIEKGMIITNEPGLYFEGKYGIRLENDVVAVPHEKNQWGDFLKFEVLTYFPFDISLIDKEMLTKNEVSWINDYHSKVYEVLEGDLTEHERLWLKEKTSLI